MRLRIVDPWPCLTRINVTLHLELSRVAIRTDGQISFLHLMPLAFLPPTSPSRTITFQPDVGERQERKPKDRERTTS